MRFYKVEFANLGIFLKTKLTNSDFFCNYPPLFSTTDKKMSRKPLSRPFSTFHHSPVNCIIRTIRAIRVRSHHTPHG